MSNLSKPRDETSAPTGVWFTIKKTASRLQDWFLIQSVGIKLLVLIMAALIPVTGIYSFTLMPKQATVAEQIKSMESEGGWTLNDKLPVVFGAGSVLSFLEANPVERITVAYKPLMWNVI